MEGDDIKFDGYGHKSKMRRLTLRGDTTGPKGNARRSTPNTDRSEAGTKAQLARIVHHTTEVMVRISGGAKTTRHVKDHMDYITRNGKLEAIDDQGEKVIGKQAVADLHSFWNLDFSNGQGKYKQAFNIVLSMPAGTDPERILVAALHFARAEIANHKFMIVLHTRDTDPHQDAPGHPHVDLIIKAEDRDRRRLHIRDDMLQSWRESFAEQLRKQGIAANASRRYERGVSLRQDGDLNLAASVERFAKNLPPILTERQQMQQAILRQQRQRLQQREQDQPQVQEPDQEPDQER